MAFNSAPGRAEYTAIAAQTIFPFTFKVYLDGDIKVYLTPTGQASDDVADILTITTDYTVSIDGDNGGSITLVSGATAGDSVTLIRDLDINRLIEYQNNGDLLADTLNQDQNYQTYLIADKDAENETHLRLPTSVQGVSVETPAPISEAYLRWNTAADALENDTTLPTSVQDAADSAAASASSASDSATSATNAANSAIEVKDKIDTVDTIADMLLLDPLINPNVNVLGYSSINDGGGGIFNYDATQSAVNNGGTIIDGWVRQYSGAVNVKWFGAKGDGITDDSPSIANCIDFCVSTGDEMHISAGTFALDSRVVKSSTSIKFTISGEGIGISKLLVNNSDGGIALNATDRDTEVLVKNIEIIANLANAGVALEITQPEGGNRHNRSVTIENVKTSVINENDSVTYGYFSTSFNVTGCWRPYFNNAIVSGPWGPGISTDLSDTSPIYKSSVGIDVDDCYAIEIHNSYIWSCSTGISAVSTANPGPEGFRMTGCNIVEVRNALKYSRPSREPTIWISDCHYNYRERGLEIIGSKLINISDCMPYNVDTSNVYTGTPYDVYFETVDTIIYTGNTHHFDGNSSRINMRFHIDADTAIIANNFFNSLANIAVSIGSGNGDITLADNNFSGTITTNVVDSSNSSLSVGKTAHSTYTIESNGASASSGPDLKLYRDSATPADNDTIGQYIYRANNDALAGVDYVITKGVILDVTSGSEEAELQNYFYRGGAVVYAGGYKPTIVDGETSMQLAISTNGGASWSTRRIQYGAADSGGTGKRALIVDN